MSWNDQRIDTLKSLWAEGLSASQIAGRLGHVTRNAVIGKAHRLGLSGRATTGRARAPRLPTASPRRRNNPIGGAIIRNKVNHHTADIPPLAAPPERHPTIADLKLGDCHWPIGDPKRPGFHFCGRAAELDHPYCPHHHALAVRVPGRHTETASHAVSIQAGTPPVMPSPPNETYQPAAA